LSDHYYSKDPSAQHNRQYIEETILGKTLKFVTDAGVFSKKGVDFGSKLLIEQIRFPVSTNLLDVGCGYGPIGLFAAVLMGEGKVTMIDINERAVSLAQENASVNGIENVQIMQSNLFESLGDKLFTTIVTNPPIRAGKKIVHQIYEGAIERLESGGELWVVIQKKQGAPSTLEKLQELFEQAEEVTKDKGYRIFRARKK
jgi:16S rRNA (guanine1207-N2)-methyltransferase